MRIARLLCLFRGHSWDVSLPDLPTSLPKAIPRVSLSCRCCERVFFGPEFARFHNKSEVLNWARGQRRGVSHRLRFYPGVWEDLKPTDSV